MFRFTIRDVLWLTVVVALAVGWTQENRRAAGIASEWRQQKADIAELQMALADAVGQISGLRMLNCPVGANPPATLNRP